MHALIDADWFAYAFGNATDDEYKPLKWPFVKARIDGTINRIVEESGAETYQLYLTSADKSNFRFEVATIRPYKGNRPSDKPLYYDKIRSYLEQRGGIVVSGMEADDAVSIEQWDDICSLDDVANLAVRVALSTIICSIDKDLDMVPGHHYNWMKPDDGVYYIEETQGLQNFYCQLLTGDNVDNIPGLFGVGKSSKLLTNVRSLTDELEMYNYVLGEYEKRFGSYAEQFLIENARLLYMLKEEGLMWEPPIN